MPRKSNRKGLRKSKNHEISRNPENLGWSIRGVFATIDNLSEIDVSFKESGEKLIFLDGKRTNQSSMNKFVKMHQTLFGQYTGLGIMMICFVSTSV